MIIENKCKMIDYLLLLKLITRKYDFGNEFYKNWLTYLLPIINYKLFMETNINCFTNIYNIYSLIRVFNISETSLINYPKNTSVKIIYNICNDNPTKILKISIIFMKPPYYLSDDYYEYKIPINKLAELCEKLYKLNDLKSFCTNNYNENKRIILYELFKKIILRLIKIKF